MTAPTNAPEPDLAVPADPGLDPEPAGRPVLPPLQTSFKTASSQPTEPWNGTPKLNTPPSDAASQ